MSGEDEAGAFDRLARGDRFEFRVSRSGVVLDFVQGRDVIDLRALGLTPWDLLPSVRGRDLVLAFEGGEAVLRGGADLKLSERDFRW